MSNPVDNQAIEKTVQENLKQAILVQARLIAELRGEVERLKDSDQSERNSTHNRNSNRNKSNRTRAA